MEFRFPEEHEPVAAGHILIVDDSPTNRAVLRNYLTALGHSVEGAENGREGLEKILTHGYDVILLDLHMPEVSGHEVLEVLYSRGLLKTLRVIVVSSNEDAAVAARCIQLGADDYISKPFNPTLLNARVQSSLERKRLRDAEQRLLTELSASLEETRQAQVQLVRQSQMVALGRLTAGVAHELNNPLGALTSASRQLAEQLKELWRHQRDSNPALAAMFANLMEHGQETAVRSTSELRAIRRELQSDFPGFTASQLETLGRLEPSVRETVRDLKSETLTPLWLAFQLADIGRTLEISAERASRVVKSLRAYSRVDQETSARVDLAAGLEDTLMVHAHQMRNVEVERRYGLAPLVPGRPGELNQVWSNLISNALEAMKYQGRLVVGVDEAPGGGGALVTVQDSGGGIRPDDLPRIFDLNFTRRSGGDFGIGLGLAIVREIIDSHHGKIEVESVPGRTCFRVFLPSIGEGK